MAKNLKNLINLAPSKAEPITGSIHWFHQQLHIDGQTWVCGRHGDVADGGGRRSDWVVPAGVTTATFHLWGAGGSGAAAACCQQGLNGGSGAYAYKKVSVTPGQRYVLCAGSACALSCVELDANTSWQCAEGGPQGSLGSGYCPVGSGGTWDTTTVACYVQGGCRGTTTYVKGPGLTNLCAEGGAPGIVGHSVITSGDCVRCQAGPNGGYGSCKCCNSYICACDILDRDPDDSGGSRFRSACYYGADGGARGLFAKFKHNCCGRFDQSTCYLAGAVNYLSFPAGQWWYGNTVSTGYGFWAGVNWHFCTDNDWGSSGPHGTARRQMLSGGVIANGQFDNGGQLMGVGGITAWTCGGPCCCGGAGGAGGIVIQYE